MKKFRADIPVWATVYIDAETKDEAMEKLRSLECTELAVQGSDDLGCELSPPATIDCNLRKRIADGDVDLEAWE